MQRGRRGIVAATQKERRANAEGAQRERRGSAEGAQRERIRNGRCIRKAAEAEGHGRGYGGVDGIAVSRCCVVAVSRCRGVAVSWCRGVVLSRRRGVGEMGEYVLIKSNQEGEIIFIPSGWHHQVVNLDFVSVSVSLDRIAASNEGRGVARRGAERGARGQGSDFLHPRPS
jgi:hypothetical protein